jgi:hypothetical protein
LLNVADECVVLPNSHNDSVRVADNVIWADSLSAERKLHFPNDQYGKPSRQMSVLFGGRNTRFDRAEFGCFPYCQLRPRNRNDRD